MILAIVIPYYKIVFFEQTLESLAKQTDKRFKVYIGDDASPESPLSILEKYKNKFDFVYHRFEKNLGGISLVQQWERCIDLIGKEKWIMLLGDDDFLEETIVASWYKYYPVFSTKSNVVRFATKSVNMLLDKVSDSFKHPLWEKATDAYFRRFKGLTRSTLSEYIYSKKAYVEFGFYDFPLAWHSDDAAWLSFSDKKPIYTINESHLFIRHSSFCISGNNDNQNLKDIAAENFYRECILKNISLFDRSQQIDLILEYEISIKKNRNLKISEWFKLLYFYFSNHEILPFLKCIRRFCLSFSK